MTTIKWIVPVLLFTSLAKACPVNLARSGVQASPTMTLCEAWDRYYMAKWQLRAKGIEAPRTVGNVMAPRFINMPDWTAKRTDLPTSAATIYSPAPMTWDHWEQGADVVDAKADLNTRARTFPALDLNWILELHGKGLAGLVGGAGHFRGGEEIGLAINEKTAMTRKQIEGILSLPFRQIQNGEKLVRFRPTDCWQKQTPAFRAQIEAMKKAGRGTNAMAFALIPSNQFFKGQDGEDHQCGFIMYAPRVQIQEQLEQWLKWINAKTSNWSSSTLPNDPIAVAANAQRWFISIHPFSDGNGRVSRYVMDLLIESLGLPAPLLGDMNNDIYTTNREWRDEVGRGIERAVLATEACARTPSALGCAPIQKGKDS